MANQLVAEDYLERIAQATELIAGKSEGSNTLEGFGIADAYTKTEIDNVTGTPDEGETLQSEIDALEALHAENKTVAEEIAASDLFVKKAGDILSGDIVPEADNTVSLGTPDKKFKEIYAHELKLSTNSLYIGDTKILGTDSDTINIKADPEQHINLKTQGAGTTNVQSHSAINIETVAENGNNPDASIIKIKALGEGSSIAVSAPTVGITGATTISNLTVTDNLTVTGAIASVNSDNLEIKDNVIVINKGETGNGVSAGNAGIKVDRGEEVPYLIEFDEADDRFKVGKQGDLQTIATQDYVTDEVLAGCTFTGSVTVPSIKTTTGLEIY